MLVILAAETSLRRHTFERFGRGGWYQQKGIGWKTLSYISCPALQIQEIQAGEKGSTSNSESLIAQTADRSSLSAGIYKHMYGEIVVSPDGKPLHMSHWLCWWAGIRYCAECGAWALHRSVKLCKPCQGKAEAAGRRALYLIGTKFSLAQHVNLLPGIDERPKDAILLIFQKA